MDIIVFDLNLSKVTPIQRKRFFTAMPKKLQRKTNPPEARCPKEHNYILIFKKNTSDYTSGF